MNRKFTLVMGHANEPERRIDSYVRPRGCLTKPGMPNNSGSHLHEYEGIGAAMVTG
ncbi:hypothetical protein [Parasphingorhabdus sp.]|jgi:hypothetical protein|uniref:hypothetical protein n=1 Tax=Parasphingorhabdus sp. TaxID=2709688 RepID=UPI003A92CC85